MQFWIFRLLLQYLSNNAGPYIVVIGLLTSKVCDLNTSRNLGEVLSSNHCGWTYKEDVRVRHSFLSPHEQWIMLQSEINRRMPDIVTSAIFGIWQSLQALGRAKGDEEEEHYLIVSQVPNIYVEDRGWQLRKVPKLMKKLWKVMSLHHQRRWKGGKINVKSYGLKRIKCLFFCAFSSSTTLPFFLPIRNKRYIPVWGYHKNSKVYWR